MSDSTEVRYDVKCQRCGLFRYTMNVKTSSNLHVSKMLANRNLQFCNGHHPPQKPPAIPIRRWGLKDMMNSIQVKR